MKFQKEEISEILSVPYEQFKKMVEEKKEDLVIYEDEYKILFDIFDREFEDK